MSFKADSRVVKNKTSRILFNSMVKYEATRSFTEALLCKNSYEKL